MLALPPTAEPETVPAPSIAATVKTVLVLGVLPESLVVFRGPLMQAMLARGHRVLACASGASAPVRAKLAELENERGRDARRAAVDELLSGLDRSVTTRQRHRIRGAEKELYDAHGLPR